MYSARTAATQRISSDLTAPSAQAFASIASSLEQSIAAPMRESFGAVQLGTQASTEQKEVPPQRALPMLGRLDGPSIVPSELVRRCKTYREAVRTAWTYRRVAYMTQRQLSAEAELRPQFVTDYLNPDDKPTRRDLPAEQIPPFEAVVGNTLVTQWLAWQASLTVLEEVQANQQIGRAA
jgi:hypothetical protein